jgi:hemerythrin-like domain-containing protein
MSSISEYLSKEHRHCDDLFVEAENAVSQSRWNDAEKPFHDFMLSAEIHFNREEQVLFPAFEQATMLSGGPTDVMRTEHRQIRSVLERLQEALKKRDMDQFLGESETLLPLLQQHNLKEESMLYRMASQVLTAQSDTLIEKMQALDITT